MSEGRVDLSKLVVGSVLVVLLMSVLTWLQGRFDTSDHKEARQIVRDYRPDGGRSISEAILSRHEGVEADQISWDSEITSGCLGHVRVSAYIPAHKEDPSTTYKFDVDLTGPGIYPTDPVTMNILKTLTATRTATAAR